jgi:predicted  nucleic acid-binding Zn-ribbon protein
LSSAEIHRLEREVEAARARLAADLSKLRSPATSSEFTRTLQQEAWGARDSLVEQAKSATLSTLQGLVDDLKAKAAANPAATLAIGTGLAWRLLRHPPIATALIGAGLFGLLRATPARISGNGASDYLAHAGQRLKQQASDLAGGVRDRAEEVASNVADQAKAAAGTLQEQTAEFAAAAKEQVEQWSADLEGAVREVPNQAASLAHQASMATQSLYDQETRNKLLLGTAGLAVVAALGLAYQRRTTELDWR